MAFPVLGKNVGSGVDQLKSQIVDWIREEIRASQRGGIGVPLDGTLGTLNNAALTSPVGTDAVTNVQSFGGSSLTGVNQVVATATFVKPSWATQCMVMAISVVTTNTVNQGTSPLSGTAWTVIGGTSSTTVDIGTQANFVFTTKAIPFNRLFPTAGNVVVETRVTTSGGAAANALSAQLASTVFWYA